MHALERAHREAHISGKSWKSLAEETALLGAGLLVLSVFFAVMYYKGSVIQSLMLGFWVWYMFTLPGYAIVRLLPLENKVLQLFIGTGTGAGIIGAASYTIGLLGLHIRFHGYLLPLIIVLVALMASGIKKR